MPNVSNRPFPLLAALLAGLALCCSAGARADTPTAASADPATAVRQMLGAAHWQQALERLQGLIQAHPDDPRWAFDRALALGGAGRIDDAIAAYAALIQRYPELPEPYNNRGVLLAAQGQLPQARESLEQALVADADFGLARENLGDVELQLAQADYAAALKLPGHSGALADKLRRLQALPSAPPHPSPSLANLPTQP